MSWACNFHANNQTHNNCASKPTGDENSNPIDTHTLEPQTNIVKNDNTPPIAYSGNIHNNNSLSQISKEKDESPTLTVFLSAPPQVVTVTAAPSVTSPPAQPSKQGANAFPPGAKIPIIVSSVVAGLAAIASLAIILWRKKKRKAEEKMALEQRAMTEADFEQFPILDRSCPER